MQQQQQQQHSKVSLSNVLPILLLFLTTTATLCEASAAQQTSTSATSATSAALSRAPSCGARQLEQCSFTDNFSRFNPGRWRKSAGYHNGPPFMSWWASRRVFVVRASRSLSLVIDRQPRFGVPFSSGEVRTNGWYGYGCYTARIRPINQPGVITTFFLWTDENNAAPGRPNTPNGINLGFLYNPSTKRHTIRFAVTQDAIEAHRRDWTPPFQAGKAFHDYTVKYTASSIIWYVDAVPRFRVSSRFPKLNAGPYKIFLNAWPVAPVAAAALGGRFVFRRRVASRFARVKFDRGASCSV